jgi:nicotinamidase-related amidase
MYARRELGRSQQLMTQSRHPEILFVEVRGIVPTTAVLYACQRTRREEFMFCFCRLISLVALAAVVAYATPAPAQTIIDDWQSIKTPPAPALKAVTLDPKTTAIMVMDFVKQTCNNDRRPRCVASIPKIEKLQAAARAQGVMLISTTVPPIPITDTLPAVAPKGNEPVVVAWVEKFMLGNKDTGLEQMLKDKGITTVVTLGTAAQGAVLYTASEAALRGFNVIVPVDGMSAEGEGYIEQAVAYILTSAPVVAPKITLTSIDMIKFQ